MNWYYTKRWRTAADRCTAITKNNRLNRGREIERERGLNASEKNNPQRFIQPFSLFLFLFSSQHSNKPNFENEIGRHQVVKYVQLDPIPNGCVCCIYFHYVQDASPILLATNWRKRLKRKDEVGGGGLGAGWYNSLFWTHWTREQICVQGLRFSASGDYQTMWSTINKSGRGLSPKTNKKPFSNVTFVQSSIKQKYISQISKKKNLKKIISDINNRH